MGIRVTWRSRPRSEYPWPLRVKQVTLAEFATMTGDGGTNFIGPLSWEAVTELCYRVKKLTFEGSTTQSPNTATFDEFGDPMEMTLDTVDTEPKCLADRAHNFDGTQTLTEPFLYDDSLVIYGFISLVDTQDFESPDTEEFFGYDVIHVTDEPGPNKYHLNGIISVGYIFPPIPYMVNRMGPGNVNDGEFEADLVLNCGTFQIPMIVDWAGGGSSANSATITATEWFQYAWESDGLPVWDSSTGDYIPEGTPTMRFANPTNSMYHPLM